MPWLVQIRATFRIWSSHTGTFRRDCGFIDALAADSASPAVSGTHSGGREVVLGAPWLSKLSEFFTPRLVSDPERFVSGTGDFRRFETRPRAVRHGLKSSRKAIRTQYGGSVQRQRVGTPVGRKCRAAVKQGDQESLGDPCSAFFLRPPYTTRPVMPIPRNAIDPDSGTAAGGVGS